MADSRSNRKGDSGASGPGRSGAESQLRLVTADGVFVEPADSDKADEAPTIISKTPIKTADLTTDINSLRGRVLAHYELIEPIGVGGMAAVLRARDTQLDRIVALKILPPEMARDTENIRRFHQEARAAARLDHENIARVFFCGEDQGLNFIAFEFVEGQNLRVLLEKRGPLPVAEAVGYVLQVATGLEHAASRGVVHRDVKPSNILITPDGRAKLVDMGLARSLEPHADNGLTQSGVTLGTFDYISPEQALEPREADSRSDVYSLGCTFYHMLTGQPPVPEGTAAKKLQHHQNVAPVDPRQLNPLVPDEIAQVLGKMMAKNPSDRYQRPIQLVQHLTQVARNTGVAQDATLDLFVNFSPSTRTSRPVFLVALGAVALAALLFALSLVSRETRKDLDPPKKPTPGGNLVDAGKGKPNVPKQVDPPVSTATIRGEADLRHRLERAVDGDIVTLDEDLVLSGGLKIAGNVEIVGGRRTPTRVRFDINQVPVGSLAGLHVEGGKVAFRNLIFEVAGGNATSQLKTQAAAVWVSGGEVEFKQCVFEQAKMLLDAKRSANTLPIAAVWCDAQAGTPRITVDESFFASGQCAFAFSGPGASRVVVRDCGFHAVGPLFHLRGGGEPTIAVEHCSAFLRHGAAFRFEGEAAARLNVESCLFSGPKDAEQKQDLIQQTTSGDASRVRYKGSANGYHNLNSLLNAAGSLIAYDDGVGFRKKIGPDGVDQNSVCFAPGSSPFLHEGKLDDEPSRIFGLNSGSTELQGLAGADADRKLPGLRRFLGATMPPLSAPTPTVADYKLAPNEKLVDPDFKGVLPPGYFTTLEAALVGRERGDVILLKPGARGEEFRVKHIDVEADLAIRGLPDTQPILTLKDTSSNDAYLFKLAKGKLEFENLQLQLEPARAGFNAQTVVALIGEGQCGFKNCLVTLKPRPGGKSVPLSLVTLWAMEDAKMMMGEGKAAPPTVTVENCFVRGEGDLLNARGSRPVAVSVLNSLVHLKGSLYHQQQGAAKEVVDEPAIAFKLAKSVFLTADPLWLIQSGKSAQRHQHPIHVDRAESCLFARLDDQPLVGLDLPEVTEKNLPNLFKWDGEKNVFVNFDTASLVAQWPTEDVVRGFRLDQEDWKMFDPTAKFQARGFNRAAAKAFWQADPEELRRSLAEFDAYFDELILPKQQKQE